MPKLVAVLYENRHHPVFAVIYNSAAIVSPLYFMLAIKLPTRLIGKFEPYGYIFIYVCFSFPGNPRVLYASISSRFTDALKSINIFIGLFSMYTSTICNCSFESLTANIFHHHSMHYYLYIYHYTHLLYK